MRHTRVVTAAFSICIALSLLVGIFLIVNVKTIPKYTHMIETGEEIVESILQTQLEEKNYFLFHRDDSLDKVKDEMSKLRRLLSFYEKSAFSKKRAEFLEVGVWEEAMNLYERLFDQFVLYHKAAEKNITEIRNLEKSILAVIYSKMNPERGIIALQEVRIHEKGYILYRNYPEPPDERAFQDKRKEAVSNLLVWAHQDKRIEELMDRDNQLFNEIMNNYERQDNTLLALKRESEKIINIGERFLEEGNKRLHLTYRRCVFLSIILSIIWLIMGIAIAATGLGR